MKNVEKLLGFSSAGLGSPLRGRESKREAFFGRWGQNGLDVLSVLALRNGFYAFESALLFRPLETAGGVRGQMEWNDHALWRKDYDWDLTPYLFFAEDIFGHPFFVSKDGVGSFNPETGEVAKLAESIEEWAGKMVSDCNFQTGYPLAVEWKDKHGALPAGCRLAPKLPFFCGGAFTIDNLYCAVDLDVMLFRASIANQIKDLPDGSEFKFVIR